MIWKCGDITYTFRGRGVRCLRIRSTHRCMVDTYPESLCFPGVIWSKTRAALKRLRRRNTTHILMYVQRVHTWCNAAAFPRPPILPFLFFLEQLTPRTFVGSTHVLNGYYGISECGVEIDCAQSLSIEVSIFANVKLQALFSSNRRYLRAASVR